MNREETEMALTAMGLNINNLRKADLSEADLRWADLRWADLRWADLSKANLSGADLREANLSGADLRGAVGPFTVFSAGKYIGIAAGGYICIGCIRLTYDEWQEQYKNIGMKYKYAQDEIRDYGELITCAIKRQKRIEGIK